LFDPEVFVVLLDWHALIENLVRLGTSDLVVSVAEKVLRPILMYLFLVFVLKRFGKRVLAQLNPFDFVVLLTLSNTVQNAIIGNDSSLSGGIIGAASLVWVNAMLVRFHYRGPEMNRQTIEDDVYLIRRHALQADALRALRINVGELTARAHERGFDDLRQVETAVLYPNGTIYMTGDNGDGEKLDQILADLRGLRGEVAALQR
jgi:uncharacterized membrane protein YcaP (DUF421 family)